MLCNYNKIVILNWTVNTSLITINLIVLPLLSPINALVSSSYSFF